jgi:hypothetical protein
MPDHLDRQTEAEELLADDGSARPVNLYGESGIGKTYVLRHAANLPAAQTFPDGIAYLIAKGMSLDDLLQALFEEFYECNPPLKVSGGEIRRDLKQKQALVIIDSFGLERDDAQALILAAPGCHFVIASSERTLWEGKPFPLKGLPVEDAIALVELELDRRLDGEERAAAEKLCTRLQGHPLNIRMQASGVREQRCSLEDVARGEVSPPALNDEEEQVLVMLSVVQDAPLGISQLGGKNVSALQPILDRLERQHLIEKRDLRYNLSGTLSKELAEGGDVARAMEQAFRYFTEWAEVNQTNLSGLLEEAPALLSLLRSGLEAGRFRDVIELGRAIDTAFAWGRRWGAWREILEGVLHSARQVRNQDAEAWALHQLGTRAFCLDGRRAGLPRLRQALSIRRAIGDHPGAAATRHNIGVIRRRPWFLAWRPDAPLWMFGMLIPLLIFLGGYAARSAMDSGSVTHTATVRNEGNGRGSVVSIPTGIRCGTQCKAKFRNRTMLSLVATASPGSVFAGWSGGGCSGTGACSVTMGSDRSVTARFDASAFPTSSLTLTRTGTGGGIVTSAPSGISCGATCMASFGNGTSVMLVATASPGSVFAGWSGGGCSGTGACSIVMNGDQSVTAAFEKLVRSLSVTRTGAGTGIVTSNPLGISCSSTCKAGFSDGSSVMLTAQADPNSVFAGWSGGGCSGTGACSIVMNGDQSVIADFVGAVALTIHSAVGGSVGVTVNGNGMPTCTSDCRILVIPRSEVQLVPLPNKGFSFNGWTDACSFATPPPEKPLFLCILDVSTDMSTTALFGVVVG